MSRDDIQKLLGGYATGTLTPEEQRALYEAALTDQELFDAMAREEALRDVLSDPAARAHLLAAIDEVPEPWYRRWWRPMAVMATAALLVAGVAVYTRPPKAPEMAKVELPRFHPPVAAQSVPMLPPAPELRRDAPVLKDLPIPLPPPKSAPPPGPMLLAVPAAAPSPSQPQRDSALTQGAIGGGPRQQGQQSQAPVQFGPPVGNRLFAAGTVQLNGTVTDPTGATVPAANVEVKSLATGETVKTMTDAKGQFKAPETPGNLYQVSASAPGFKQVTVDQATPVTGTPEPVNLRLDIGTAAETVDVTASARALPATGRAVAGGRGGAGVAAGSLAELKAAPVEKKAKAEDAPVLHYQLLQNLQGRNRSEFHADDNVPAGASLTLRITPAIDGYLRIVEGGRTVASPRVRHGAPTDVALGTFDKPGHVELQVYFAQTAAAAKDQAAPAITVAFNVQ